MNAIVEMMRNIQKLLANAFKKLAVRKLAAHNDV